MLIYIYLSGEHRTIPAAEARAVAEAEKLPFDVKAQLDQVLIVETDPLYINFLAIRAAFTKMAGEVLGIVESSEGISGIKKVLRDVDLDAYKVNGVAFKRVKHYCPEIRADEVINLVRNHLRLNYYTEKSPENILDLILSDGLIIVGLRRYTRDLKVFRVRDPQRRPIYRPGTLTPEFSRVFVNLSRASITNNDIFLDPFCGVGGFLLEACVIGLRICGCDINPSYVEGAVKNLEFYNCLPNVVVADACNPPFSRVDAVGTDPPYGRLTKAPGYNTLRTLMLKFLESASGVIRKGRYIVFAQRRDVIQEEDIEDLGFIVVEHHKNWVHGSLTRDIFVVKRI